MGEINQTSTSRKKVGVQQAKKLSTRVDLTPMVDLGFLLITFFIFTTTMQESKAMNLIMPNDSQVDRPLKHPSHKAISFLLGGNDSLYFYKGLDIATSQLINYKEARNIIINQKQFLEQTSHDGQDLLVLIKPSQHAAYKNIMKLLDEMLINEVSKYMLLEPSSAEILRMK